MLEDDGAPCHKRPKNEVKTHGSLAVDPTRNPFFHHYHNSSVFNNSLLLSATSPTSKEGKHQSNNEVIYGNGGLNGNGVFGGGGVAGGGDAAAAAATVNHRQSSSLLTASAVEGASSLNGAVFTVNDDNPFRPNTLQTAPGSEMVVSGEVPATLDPTAVRHRAIFPTTAQRSGCHRRANATAAEFSSSPPTQPQSQPQQRQHPQPPRKSLSGSAAMDLDNGDFPLGQELFNEIPPFAGVNDCFRSPQPPSPPQPTNHPHRSSPLHHRPLQKQQQQQQNERAHSIPVPSSQHLHPFLLQHQQQQQQLRPTIHPPQRRRASFGEFSASLKDHVTVSVAESMEYFPTVETPCNSPTGKMPPPHPNHFRLRPEVVAQSLFVEGILPMSDGDDDDARLFLDTDDSDED